MSWMTRTHYFANLIALLLRTHAQKFYFATLNNYKTSTTLRVFFPRGIFAIELNLLMYMFWTWKTALICCLVSHVAPYLCSLLLLPSSTGCLGWCQSSLSFRFCKLCMTETPSGAVCCPLMLHPEDTVQHAYFIRTLLTNNEPTTRRSQMLKSAKRKVMELLDTWITLTPLFTTDTMTPCTEKNWKPQENIKYFHK